MGKVIALLLMILLTLASVAGYLLLHGKITAGEKQIAGGQRLIEKEQITLDEGKAKLEAGKLKSSDGKKRYEKAHRNRFLVLADKLLKGGKGFKDARDRIAEGDERVAKGEVKVNTGEKRLEAGKLQLSQGRERVKLAKRARVACALGTALFASLSIVLGFRWRRSLARIFVRTDA